MNGQAGTSLNLLLFSVGGVHFGIDAEQALGTAADEGEEADDLFWFHEELGFGNGAIKYLSPTVITVRAGGKRQYRVVIDAMEDVTEFDINAIRPFPIILEPFVLRKGMWGVLPRDGRMTMLLDFTRLFKDRD
jgi:hypothetical protein